MPASNWGNGVTPAKYRCASDKCRFVVQKRAVDPLTLYLKSMELDRLPLLACPQHPEAPIAINATIDEEDPTSIDIRVRCTARPKDSRFCECSFTLNNAYEGPMGAWYLTCLGILYEQQ